MMLQCRCLVLMGMVLCLTTVVLAAPVSDGVLHIKSRHGVANTTERAKRMIEYYDLHLLGEVDYTSRAGSAARLIIFNHAKAALPAIRKNPLAALDMPLKLLVWDDGSGVVWISYNSAEYLALRHRLPLKDNGIQNMAKVLRELGAAAADK